MRNISNFNIGTVATLVNLGVNRNLISFISNNLDLNPAYCRHDFIADNLSQLIACSHGFSDIEVKRAAVALVLLHIGYWYNSDDYIDVATGWLESIQYQPFSQEYYGIEYCSVPVLVDAMRNHLNPTKPIHKLVLAGSYGDLEPLHCLRRMYLYARTVGKLSVADSLDRSVKMYSIEFNVNSKSYQRLKALAIPRIDSGLAKCLKSSLVRKESILSVSSNIATWEQYIKGISYDD